MVIRSIRLIFVVSVFLFTAGVFMVLADDFTSSSFKVSAPVLFSGEYSTSTGFQLFGTISQLAIGTSSVTGYDVASGFLYFPIVTAPTPSATAGDSKVDLSWSAATAAQGWSIGGYNVGQSTVSGGPYTYSSSLGNVTSSSRTGLTNGTTYYFIVRAQDAFGKSIATSSEVSAAPVAAAAAPTTTPTTGGGAPGSVTIPGQNVGRAEVSGLAYPGGRISLLLDGGVAATTVADINAAFSHIFSALGEGSYVLGVIGQDDIGLRSPLVTFPLIIKKDKTTVLAGMLVPPTLTTDKIEVRQGYLITISGRSLPDADIFISIDRGNSLRIARVRTNSAGAYILPYDTKDLENGRYTARTRVRTVAGQQSAFSLSVLFDIGDEIVERELLRICDGAGALVGDANNDCRVNIVDFSILAYWFDKQKTQEVPLRIDFTGDGIIDLADFSVAAYYWTG